jgi:SulP family sulfate permease
MASLFFMKKMGDHSKRHSEIAPVIKEKAWRDEKHLSDAFLKKVFIKHLNGPLFFGFTSDFQQLSKQIPKTAKMVLIRMDKVPLIDQSGLYALEDVIIDLERQGIEVLLVGLQEQPKYLMKVIGMIGELIEEEHLFENFSAARLWINQQNGGIIDKISLKKE